MRYVSVGCVVGIIAGFCIGPGERRTSPTCNHSPRERALADVQLVRWITLLPAGGLRNSRQDHRRVRERERKKQPSGKEET